MARAVSKTALLELVKGLSAREVHDALAAGKTAAQIIAGKRDAAYRRLAADIGAGSRG